MAGRWHTFGAVVLAVTAVGLTSCSSGDDDDAASAVAATTSTTVAPTTTTAPHVYRAAVARETVVDPAYRQGLARVDGGWLFSFNDGLFLTDDALRQTAKALPAIPPEWKQQGYNHIGDVDVVDGTVYVPLEQPNMKSGEQAMLLYDAKTLAYRSGVKVAQHHDSFVTVDPSTGTGYSMDQFGGRFLLRYDTRDGWKQLDPLRLSRRVERVQGGDVRDGAMWLSTDDATDGVYRVDLATGAVQSLGSVGHVDGEGEGIDATPTDAGDLHVLSMDVKVVPARLIDLTVR